MAEEWGDEDTWEDQADLDYGRRPQRVDEDTIAYIRQLEIPLQDVDAEDDMLETMVENAYKEIRRRQAALAAHKGCSFVLELLLRKSTTAQLCAFADSLHGYLEFLCTNPYGSHVVQTLLALLAPVVTVEDDGETKDGEPSAEASVLQMCEEFRGHWVELLGGPPASHPLRSTMLVLCGREVKEAPAVGGRAVRGGKGKKKGKKKRAPGADVEAADNALPKAVREVPPSFHAAFEGVVQELLSTTRSVLGDMVSSDAASAVLQMALELAAEAGLPTSDAFAKRLLGAGDEVYDADAGGAASTSAKDMVWVEELIAHGAASHVVEVAARVTSDKLFGSMLKTWVLPKVVDLAHHPIANFVLQAFLASARTTSQVDALSKALCPHLGSLFAKNRMGVVWRLAEAAAKTDDRDVQKAVITAVLAVPAEEGVREGAVQWILGVTGATSEGLGTSTEGLLPNGCRIVKALLGCRPAVCRPVLESLLALNSRQLVDLACSPWGSRHVVEPVLEAPPDFAWAKQRMFAMFKGQWATLAQDRFGCWAVEKSFVHADTRKKALLAGELVVGERALTGSHIGRRVLQAVRLEHFKRDADTWAAHWGSADRKKAMFSDMLTKAKGRLGAGGGKAAAPATPAAPKPAKAEKKGKKEKKEKKGKKEKKEKVVPQPSSGGAAAGAGDMLASMMSAAKGRLSHSKLDPFMATLGFGADDAKAEKKAKKKKASRDRVDGGDGGKPKKRRKHKEEA